MDKNQEKKQWYCTKDLYMCTGELSFKEGGIYDEADSFDHQTTVIDEQGDEHRFGTWFKYFKPVE